MREYIVCSECGISFTRDLDLKVHMKKHEKDREKKKLLQDESEGIRKSFQCPHCQKTFITQSRYNAHLNVFHKIITKKDRKDVY